MPARTVVAATAAVVGAAAAVAAAETVAAVAAAAAAAVACPETALSLAGVYSVAGVYMIGLFCRFFLCFFSIHQVLLQFLCWCISKRLCFSYKIGVVYRKISVLKQ